MTTCVDGVSFAGHGLPEYRLALGADVNLFSLYLKRMHLILSDGLFVMPFAALKLGNFNAAIFYNEELSSKWFVLQVQIMLK